MAMRVQRHANGSKQATLLDGLDVSPLEWRVYGCGLNRFVHEGMNHISNVKVQWKCKYFLNYYLTHVVIQELGNTVYLKSHDIVSIPCLPGRPKPHG